MNNKGQALIEFILIVPILLLIFIALIDVGKIFINKYELNNTLEVVADLYNNNEESKLAAFIANEDVNLKKKANGEFVTLTLEKKVSISAPVLSNVLGKNFTITSSKNIYEDNLDE